MKKRRGQATYGESLQSFRMDLFSESMSSFRIAPPFQNRSNVSESLRSFRITPQFQNRSKISECVAHICHRNHWLSSVL